MIELEEMKECFYIKGLIYGEMRVVYYIGQDLVLYLKPPNWSSPKVGEGACELPVPATGL